MVRVRKLLTPFERTLILAGLVGGAILLSFLPAWGWVSVEQWVVLWNNATGSSLKNGLVGYWPMDADTLDTTNTTAEVRDASGSGNHGDWVNHSLTTAAGVRGQALSFDGVDDYVSVSDDPSLNFTGAFSVSAWVYSNGNQNANVVAKHQSAYTYGPWRLQTNAGNSSTVYLFTVGNMTDTEWHATGPEQTGNDGQWIHLVGVFRPGQAVELWQDGQLVAQNTSNIPSSLPTTSNPLIIGARHTQGGGIAEFFNGLIDDVRVYNRALSPEEVEELYALGSTKSRLEVQSRPIAPPSSLANGLLLHWTIDGDAVDLTNASAEIRDTSGNNLNGDWRNHASTLAPGVLGQAVELDGYNDDISGGSPASLDNLANFTYAAWIRLDAYASDFMPIMGKGVGTGANATKRFLVNSGGGCTGGDGSTNGCIEITINTTGAERVAFTPAGTIKPGQWYHVAVTYQSGTAPRIFVNGTEATYLSQSAGSGTDADESTGPFLVGSWNHDGSLSPGGAGWFNGLIDDVRVYNRALSPEEVEELYALGRK